MHDSLWFIVAGVLVEVGAHGSADAAPPVVLGVGDPDALAERCWDVGFTVRVNEDATGRAPVSVFDPFGRRIDLVPEGTAMSVVRSA